MTAEVRILLLEDSVFDAELVERALRSAVPESRVLVVSSPETYASALTDFAPDLVLSDNSLPSYDALAALAASQRVNPDVGFIVVSGTVGEESAVEMLRCGVLDYVLKDRLTRLGPVVRRALADAGQRRVAREAEAAASEANERFKAVSDGAPVGVFQTDSDMNYTFVNPRWVDLTGITADQALGHRWGSLLWGRLRRAELHPGFVDADPAATDASKAVDVDLVALPLGESRDRYTMKVPGSITKTLVVNAASVHDGRGDLLGWVGTVADITAEVRAEAAITEARDQARAASALKSHLLANMSHEIRTPMIGIIGMTDLLLESDLDARQRDYAETVRASGNALMTVINDILDFSKVEAGKLVIEAERFRVQTVVDAVVDLLAGPAQAKGLDLIGVIGEEVPTIVTGDPGRVRQVLMNLVGNAIKFTETGEIVVRGGFPVPGAAGPMLCFEVSDTGRGIGSDELAMIFEPFTQADTSTSRKYGGTGLGLAISRQLVGLMGGEISATSRPGGGSTFSFTVGVRVDATPERTGRVMPDPGLNGVTALVVDDSAAQRGVLADYLTRWGMVVEAVGSGEAALATMRRAADDGRPFTLALLDQMMPGMNGEELATAIASDPALSTQLVLMTGLSASGYRGDPTSSPFSAIVSKPVHKKALRSCLRSALGLPTRVRSVKTGTPEDSPVENNAPRPGRLLLAEDNLVNQKVTVAMLASAGYLVDTVLNGSAAVIAAAEHAYDAILMDCQMPGLNGYQATAAIRTQEGSVRHTPIIALTAGARNEDRERCLAEGMDDYLAKPVSKAALLALVGQSVRA